MNTNYEHQPTKERPRGVKNVIIKKQQVYSGISSGMERRPNTPVAFL